MKNRFLLILCLMALFSCTKNADPEIVVEHVVDTLYIVTPTTDISGQMVSIQAFDVLPENSAAKNKINLQKAIDACASAGAALYVTPAEDGYKVDAGLVLKKNVSLIGAHGPTGRGTCNNKGDGPTGSLFVITDSSAPFITVESATQISGIQFYYPNQPWQSFEKVKEYPPTIQVSQTKNVTAVTLRDLSFYGEYMAMDFRSPAGVTCEQILFEDCYGYPLGGEFIAIDRCYDIPRILHCHVNPANMREFGRSYNLAVVDYVAGKGKYCYSIDHTDEAVLMDVFAFGVYGGFYFGPSTYGEMTSFDVDSCIEGIHICGDGYFNRIWHISQGTLITNVGNDATRNHPVVIEGNAYVTISSVTAFCCKNCYFTSVPNPWDFMLVKGEEDSAITLSSCSITNYESDFPFTLENPYARVRATNFRDKNYNYIDYETDGQNEECEHDVLTVFDNCDSAEGWITYSTTGVSVDTSEKTEGEASLSVTTDKVELFAKTFAEPVDSRCTMADGHLLFDFYVSDASNLDLEAESSIELTSSGTFDDHEISWQLNSIPALQTGWNSLDLKFSDTPGYIFGRINFKAINYFRIYTKGISKETTFKIDNLRFYQE